MNEMNNVQDRARSRHAAALEKRRQEERADALDFLINGDLDGRHTDRCVHAIDGKEPCSRDYNPAPYRESTPDPKDYAGTGIGALYGYENTRLFLMDLRGWNITKRREIR